MNPVIKPNKRLKLSAIQSLTHYGVVFYLLVIASFSVWNLIEIYVTNSYSGFKSVGEIIKNSVPFLALALVFGYIQNRRLRFKEIKIAYTEDQFQEAIQRTAKELEWKIEENNVCFFKAHRTWNWTASWGEMITILKSNDQLFLNSICNPNNMSSITSYGWNRKNIQTFLKNLKDVKENKPAQIKDEKVINEWGANRIFIRLIAYPICVAMILFGTYVVSESTSVGESIVAVGFFLVAFMYLFSDIKILTRIKTIKR